MKPHWLSVKIPSGSNYRDVKQVINEKKLNTICKEAKCPNISLCWNKKHVTFLIMGNNCTRHCRFCNVEFGTKPEAIDNFEPGRIADAVKRLSSNYIVITSVTRDDLSDNGAASFINTVDAIRENGSNVKIELLIPEMEKSNLIRVINAGPDVIGHNIETIDRLYKILRPEASYKKSLEVLKNLSNNVKSSMKIKSSMIIGMGEDMGEIFLTIEDLWNNGVDIFYIGQYLQPSKKHHKVQKYYTPAEFEEIKRYALGVGFQEVESGPLVRSSFAKDALLKQGQSTV